MLKRKVKQFIEHEGLLEKGDKVLVGLSGGADSVALLRVLLQLGYTCEAAHCNFHLRGAESNRDEAFVTDLCQQLNVPLQVKQFQTKAYAKKKGISIEMAARDLRYDWFARTAEKLDCAVIAVAHHQDDSIETFLLNLIRGTGLKGLRGMHPEHFGVIRPLLCVNREEVLDYLKHLKQPYVTDSTNLQTDFTRNKIRLELLPLLESINPAIKQRLLLTMDHLKEALLIYYKGIFDGMMRVMDEKGINIEKLLAEPSPQSLLYEYLSPSGFNESQISDIMQALKRQSGKVFTSKDVRVIKDRTHLIMEDIEEPTPPELEQEELPYTPDFKIPKDKDVACIDADKLNGDVNVRLWEHGDWFIPFGMKGKKLISDFLTDLKKSVSEKDQQYLLCCGDEVVWVIGERIDNRYRVDNHTKRVIIFRKKA
jgi:tRNA(Ile)-lysidine synthase